VVGDGYGWWGVLPIVGVGMGRSYPMGMYLLPSLAATEPPHLLHQGCFPLLQSSLVLTSLDPINSCLISPQCHADSTHTHLVEHACNGAPPSCAQLIVVSI
jgi:hypothetical protein